MDDYKGNIKVHMNCQETIKVNSKKASMKNHIFSIFIIPILSYRFWTGLKCWETYFLFMIGSSNQNIYTETVENLVMNDYSHLFRT